MSLAVDLLDRLAARGTVADVFPTAAPREFSTRRPSRGRWSYVVEGRRIVGKVQADASSGSDLRLTRRRGRLSLWSPYEPVDVVSLRAVTFGVLRRFDLRDASFADGEDCTRRRAVSFYQIPDGVEVGDLDGVEPIRRGVVYGDGAGRFRERFRRRPVDDFRREYEQDPESHT